MRSELTVVQACFHELQQALTDHVNRHSHRTARLCQLLREAWQCRAFCASVDLESVNSASALKSARFAGCSEEAILHLKSMQLTLTYQQVKEIVVSKRQFMIHAACDVNWKRLYASAGESNGFEAVCSSDVLKLQPVCRTWCCYRN